MKSAAQKASCELEIRPLIAFRDYHGTTHANNCARSIRSRGSGRRIGRAVSGLPRLYFAHNSTALDPQGDWYYGFEYAVETGARTRFERGSVQPVHAAFFELAESTIIASTQRHTVAEAAGMRERENCGVGNRLRCRPSSGSHSLPAWLQPPINSSSIAAT